MFRRDSSGSIKIRLLFFFPFFSLFLFFFFDRRNLPFEKKSHHGSRSWISRGFYADRDSVAMRVKRLIFSLFLSLFFFFFSLFILSNQVFNIDTTFNTTTRETAKFNETATSKEYINHRGKRHKGSFTRAAAPRIRCHRSRIWRARSRIPLYVPPLPRGCLYWLGCTKVVFGIRGK